MRRIVILLLLSPLAGASDIDRLDWLSGCWSYDNREVGSGEYWMRPAGGTMFALSRIVKDSRTVAFEYLQIKVDDSGSLVLVASPSGQRTAEFGLLSLAENKVAFENPDHDFPQRIIYQRDGDQLLGRIEGISKERPVSIDFPMTLMDCDDFGA